MLTKKNIGIICFIITVIVSSAIFLFYTPKSAEQKEVEVYVNKLLSFSGKLTPSEKKDYLETIFALEKLTANLKDQSEMDRLIPPADFEVLLEHAEKIIDENPDIIPPSHSHAHGQGHEEVYEREQIKKDELAKSTLPLKN